MHRTDIEWADFTWNPLTGCLHKCEYCYAERLSTRFSGDIRLNKSSDKAKIENGIYVLDEPFKGTKGNTFITPFGFEPTYHRYRLDYPDTVKMGANIFVGSMADVFGEWVPDEVIKEIFGICAKYPRHNYMFLTKNPARYEKLHSKGILPDTENIWLGTSVPTDNTQYFFSEGHNTFISIEPLLGEFTGDISEGIDWVIIGAETGQRRNKVVPKKEWITYIVDKCDKKNIPVFMKDSLIPIVGEDNMRRDMPEGLKTVRPSDDMHSRVYDKCHYCGKENLMREMVLITYRMKKGEPTRKLFYSCKECFEKKFGGILNEETQLQND